MRGQEDGHAFFDLLADDVFDVCRNCRFQPGGGFVQEP